MNDDQLDFMHMDDSEPEPSPYDTPETPAPAITFQGNNYDLTALVGLVISVTVIFTCITCSQGVSCLPLIAIILGVVGLVSARESVDPNRTRLWSWISIGTGGVVLVLIILAVVAYIGLFVLAASSDPTLFQPQ